MTYTVDTSAKAITLQGDATFDELKALGEMFTGYTVKMQTLTVTVESPDPLSPFRTGPNVDPPSRPWYPGVDPNKPYWLWDPTFSPQYTLPLPTTMC